jgi:superfamily II DNA or RNA helicase
MRHAKASDCDIMFGDECHELAADQAAAELVRWQNSRNYGLSASHDMRYDGKDLRMHGIFGPVVFEVDYAQAQAANMVVPIKVIWSRVVMDYDPCGNYEDVEKKRHGFWRNEWRNTVIAEDARRYDEDTQVLITVETLEHAMNLKKLLPEYTLVYMENGLSSADRERYAKKGFCKSSEPLMDLDRRQQLTKDFETGKLKKVICTTVWNVGVSFNNLAVLIRADGGGSAINDIQIPGRVSRTAANKDCGVVHDYLDQFNPGYKTRARNRAKTYEQNRWEQVFPMQATMQEYLG